MKNDEITDSSTERFRIHKERGLDNLSLWIRALIGFWSYLIPGKGTRIQLRAGFVINLWDNARGNSGKLGYGKYAVQSV